MAYRPGGLAQTDWTTLTDADRKSYQLGHNAGVKHQKQITKREWVGLSDEEQQQAYEQWQNEGWGVFYKAIEAKLKEKNA